MVDKVRPLKLESTATGGSQDDLFPTALNPSEDYVSVKGVAFENDDLSRIERDPSGNINFADTIVGEITLEELLPMNFYFIADGTTRTIFENYETVVTDLTVSGFLTIDGRLTFL